MINPQEEAIKRLIAMAKSGSQRTPLAPRVMEDISDPPVGLMWIREDEQKAYLKISEDTTLLVASAAPVSGEGSIAERSLPGTTLQLNTLTADEIRDEAIGTSELAMGAVTGDKWAPTVTAQSNLFLDSQFPGLPGLRVDVPFDQASDIARFEFNGVQRLRLSETHLSVGLDLPGQSAMSVQTALSEIGLRVRSGGSPMLLEKSNGQTLMSVDPSGNITIAGSISSLSGNSNTAGSLAVQGALTVTDQTNLLSGLQVAERVDLLAEFQVNGQSTFNAEVFLPASYSAKVGQAVHLRTNAANENRLILEGVSAVGTGEVQFGTGGPVLRGSLAQNDRMFIGDQRIVTSAPNGILGNQLATDTITGGNGPGVGNIASETIYGYNIKNGSITSTELSPGAVVAGAIAAGAVGSVELADGSVIDRVVASLGVGKLISGTLNADEVFMGPSGHIYLGPTYTSEILDERIQIDSSGIRAYNSFNTPLAEFTPGGFSLRTGVDGARLEFDAQTGIELFGAAGERNGYLSPLGQFQLESAIDGARMSLNSNEGVQFFAGATKNLAYNPGFIGSSEHEVPVAGEASNDQRHVFAGEYAVRFRSTNPNINAPSYVDVPFKNTVGTGSSVTRTQVNYCVNPSVATTANGWLVLAPNAQNGSFGPALGFINDRAVAVTATAAGAGYISAPICSTTGLVQWAASCSVRVSTAQNITVDIIWYDVNNAVISTDTSPATFLKTNVVTQLGLVRTAPSNATSFRLRVNASMTTTDKLEVSNVLYERTSGVGPYFDGYQVGYQWDGTPGISTSSLIPAPVLDSANNLLSVFVWSDVAAWAQIEGRDSTDNVSRGLSVATRLIPNQWSRVFVKCTGRMDKVRLHYPSTDPSRQTRIIATPVWWSGVQVEADKDTPTPFCSGNEPGCRWEGLEGKSASIRDRDVVVTQISPTLGTTVSGAIVGGSLTSASFFAGRIFGTYINGGTIEGNIIRGNQISGDQILANSIQGTSLVTRTVTTDQLAANTIEAINIKAASITGDKITALTITTGLLAANAVTAEKITAGSVTADKMQANMILSQRIIVGAAATGARMELTPGMGLQAFTAGGTRTFWIDSSTGNITAIGTWRTGTSGERIEILTDGTQNFYASNNTIVGVIENTTGGLVFRGAGSSTSTTGRFYVANSNVSITFGNTSGSQPAAFRADNAGTQSWGRLVGMRYMRQYSGDGTEPRIFMLGTDNSGNDIGKSVLHVSMRTTIDNSPMILAPGSDVGLVFANEAGTSGPEVYAVNGNTGNQFRSFRANDFLRASSEVLKREIQEIELTDGRTSWDVIEGAPSLNWKYVDEAIESSTPKDDFGNVLKLRKVNTSIDSKLWQTLPEDHPDKWVWEDFSPVSAYAEHQWHRGPLAEDLHAVDSNLVRGDISNSVKMAASIGDQLGIIWDAVDMLIKRNRLLEEKLSAILPRLNLPDRPQKGDMVEGVGAHRAGRTRRTLDAATGQVTKRRRRTQP